MTFAWQKAAHGQRRDRFDGTSMKAVMAKITRNVLFRVVFALLTASSLGGSVWAYSGTQNQDCSSNCERTALPEIGRFSQLKPPAVHPVNFASTEQVGALQPMEARGAEVHAAVPRVTPSNPDASDGGSGPGPGPQFFLTIGSVLIGIRLIISYRSRKVRKLAAETH
jgi:hypothetical protein